MGTAVKVESETAFAWAGSDDASHGATLTLS